MLRNKTQTTGIYSLYRPWKRAIGPVLIPGHFCRWWWKCLSDLGSVAPDTVIGPGRLVNNRLRASIHWSKKIKMIESERASERAGGPARKQEYVVVKKKKTIDLFNYGII